MKRVTIKQALEAIRQNGYPQEFIDGYFNTGLRLDEEQEFERACAIGQGAVNLGVDAFQLGGLLKKVKYEDTNLYYYIVDMNDIKNKSLEEIMDSLPTLPEKDLRKWRNLGERKYKFVGLKDE